MRLLSSRRVLVSDRRR